MDVLLAFIGYCSQAVGQSTFPRCKPLIRPTANSTVTICNCFSVYSTNFVPFIESGTHKIQLLVTILSQMTTVRNLPPGIFEVHFNVILPPNLGLLNGLLPSGFQTTTLYSFSHTAHAKGVYPSHSPFF